MNVTSPLTRKGVVPELLRRAVVIALLFGIFQAAGGRECTSVLCGTRPEIAGSFQLAALTGVAYIISYILFTVVAPVLAIAAGILAIWHRRLRRDEDRDKDNDKDYRRKPNER
jgi:hypothetical protein